MGIDLSQFHQTFLEESFEGLEVMESSLLNMDSGADDPDIINTIFRAAHSIKGGSATFGFNNIASFTHVMETLLDQMRSGERSVNQEDINLLLRSVDCVRAMLSAEKNGESIEMTDIDATKAQLERTLSGGSVDNKEESTATGAAAGSMGSGWRIHFRPHQDMLKTGNDPVRIIREVSSLGPIDVQIDDSEFPEFLELNPEDSYLAWIIELHGDIEEKAIREIFEWVIDDCSLEIEPMQTSGTTTAGSVDSSADSEKAATIALVQDKPDTQEKGNQQEKLSATAGKTPAKSRQAAETGSIRVSIDKVDELINLVGELVITQSMLGQLGEDFDMSRLEKLRDGLGQLERNTRELQENVMRIRMLPISFAFNRFPRLVHDLSAQLGKQVELKMSGEQTELDKTVMEKIGDPLVHLVRNSLDHGIEMPDERKAAGKSPKGTLHLNAYHKGGNIVIEITDDGAGLNKDKILRKAIQNGLVNEGDELPDEKIHELIFAPGFSTADQVSDVSGRGVGMDVVKRNIRELGGNIEIRSTEGEGSTITIRLPLTLAIMDGQLVRVGNETYIVPIVSIIESLQAKQERVNSIVDRAEVYKLRDEYISILRLYETFDLKPDTEEIDNGLLVVVEGDGRKVGLFVDELLAQQQVVIKSLETNYKRIEGISGATILGDGTVAMILDIPGLITLSQSINAKNVNKVA